MTAARRAARIAFGLVLIAGAAVLVATWSFDDPIRPSPALVLVASWCAAFGVAAAVHAIVARAPVVRESARLVDASVVVPTVGIALLLPLTLHLVVWVVLAWLDHEPRLDSFDRWAAISIALVGHTHVVLALLAGFRASQLVKGRRPIRICTIYLTCVVISLVPFIVPAVVVAVTGLPFIPLLQAQARIAAAERAAIDVPLAVARSA